MSNLKVTPFPAGPLDTNGYLLVLGDDALVIDPSYNSSALIDYIKSNKLTLCAVLLTHGHFDHYLGIHEFEKEFENVPMYMNEDDRFMLLDANVSGASMIDSSLVYTKELLPLTEGSFAIGPFEFQNFTVPGHTPGGTAFFDGTNLFTGDVLFASSVGRSDFPYSNGRKMMEAIAEKLLILPEETIVWPGHGMNTTIGRELRNNPFFS